MTKRPLILSPSFVDRVREPGRYGDNRGGHGLSLLVKVMKSGRVSRSWSQRVRIDGRLTNKGLGSYPIITLSHARKLAMENRRALAEGRNPWAPGVPSFREAAEKVLVIQRESWRGAKTRRDWVAMMDHYILPKLGEVRIDRLTAKQILGVLGPLWSEKRTTAQRLRTMIGIVSRWAVSQGYMAVDPAGPALSQALPAKRAQAVRHHAAVSVAEVPGVFARIADADVWLGVRLALRFLFLTAARSGEARGATWAEIDLEAREWRIPGERTKTGAAHIVPLSNAALSVLAEARLIRNETGLIFPGQKGGVLADATLSRALRGLGTAATVHGSRSSFRTWCGDAGVARELAEASLGHAYGNQVEQSYIRTTLVRRRRAVMCDWAHYLTRQPAKVIQLRA